MRKNPRMEDYSCFDAEISYIEWAEIHIYSELDAPSSTYIVKVFMSNGNKKKKRYVYLGKEFKWHIIQKEMV